MNQREKDIGVVVRGLSLEHRRDSLEAHPGVHVLRGQLLEFRRTRPVVLDEDQVPDLHHARVAGVDERPAGAIRRQVDVDLGARPAWARLAHLPEIVLLPEPEDVRRLDVGFGFPETLGLVVGFEDRRVQPLLLQPPHVRQQLPCPGDGLGLVIVAERPVAEHLEERVVVGVPAHLLEVVVLPADPDAFLGVDGPAVRARAGPQEYVLELVHPGVGEQERGIPVGDDRGARDDPVVMPRKEVQETLSDLGGGHHTSI